MWRFALAIAYLSSTLTTSPCLAVPSSAKSNRKSIEVTLAQFLEKLKIDGQVTQFASVFIKLMGFPPDSTKKTLSVVASKTTDGIGRIADLVFSRPESGDGSVPVALFWTTRLEVDRRSESYDYRTALDGKLEKAFRVDGQTDENGYDIRGGSKLTKLDVSAPEVQERFQRDVLDFWLKGKGRKKAGGKAAPAKRPANPR